MVDANFCEMPMPREGNKTLLKTSLAEIIVKLIDAYRKKHSRKSLLTNREMSRTEVMELAILELLEKQGELDTLLKSHGYSDAAIQNIKQRLKEERDTSQET
jgi:hypothetical protein